MLLRAILLQSLLLSPLAHSAPERPNCTQSLSDGESAEIEGIRRALALNPSYNPQVRQMISKRIQSMSPKARIAILAMVSEWNFESLVKELRQKPGLAAAFNEFNTAFDQYKRNRENFAGGQWEHKNDRARLAQAQQKLTSELQSSSLPAERKAAYIEAMKTAVAALQNQGAQRIEEGNQVVHGAQAGAVVVVGALASAGLIWLSAATLGLTGTAAVGVTSATGSAFLAMIGAGAAGGAGTAGLVGTASIAGNAAITANANRQNYFCSLAQEASARGPATFNQALQAAVVGGTLVGGLGLLPTTAGQIVGGSVIVGGTGASLVHSGIEGTKAYQTLQQAQQAAARGDNARARQLYAEAQRLALDAGLTTVANAAGAALVAKSVLTPRSATQETPTLHGSVSYNAAASEEHPTPAATSVAQNPSSEFTWLNLDRLPEDLQNTITSFNYPSESKAERYQEITKLMLAYLQKKGIKAELMPKPGGFKGSMFIRILPSTGSGSSHWMTELATQMSKDPTHENLVFDTDYLLPHGPENGAQYSHKHAAVSEKPESNFLILPLQDLNASQMSSSAKHELTHYSVAQAAYVNGKDFNGWIPIRITVRDLDTFSPEARNLYNQTFVGYRTRHLSDEVYAHFEEAQALLQDLTANPRSSTAAKSLKRLQDCIENVQSLGKYDHFALKQMIQELKQNPSSHSQQLSDYYSKDSNKLISINSADFKLLLPSKLLNEASSPIPQLERLLESQIQAIDKVLAETASMQERLLAAQKSAKHS